MKVDPSARLSEAGSNHLISCEGKLPHVVSVKGKGTKLLSQVSVKKMKEIEPPSENVERPIDVVEIGSWKLRPGKSSKEI